ncbi:MAG TPA: hypothetical protein VF728_02285, partial [Nocardioides sp.]
MSSAVPCPVHGAAGGGSGGGSGRRPGRRRRAASGLLAGALVTVGLGAIAGPAPAATLYASA